VWERVKGKVKEGRGREKGEWKKRGVCPQL